MSAKHKFPLFSHYLKRKDGVVQRYRMRVYRLGPEYRQLPRTRALERKFGKRVRVYEKIKIIVVPPPKPKNFYFCFVKGFMTRRGRSPGGIHWVDTSVDVWLEFVVAKGDVDKVPSDKEMIGIVEDVIDGLDAPACYIRVMKQVKHEWGVEKKETEDAVTWPFGKLTLYRMPDYDVMEKVERVKIG